jgi:hypothetical protein
VPEMPQAFHDSGGHQTWEDFSIDNIEGGFPYGAVPPWLHDRVRVLRVIVSFLALNGLGQSTGFNRFRPFSQWSRRHIPAPQRKWIWMEQRLSANARGMVIF